MPLIPFHTPSIIFLPIEMNSLTLETIAFFIAIIISFILPPSHDAHSPILDPIDLSNVNPALASLGTALIIAVTKATTNCPTAAIKVIIICGKFLTRATNRSTPALTNKGTNVSILSTIAFIICGIALTIALMIAGIFSTNAVNSLIPVSIIIGIILINVAIILSIITGILSTNFGIAFTSPSASPSINCSPASNISGRLSKIASIKPRTASIIAPINVGAC